MTAINKMSLLWLSSADFELRDGKSGKSLCSRVPGVALIMFYSNNCSYCDELMPIMRKLPGTLLNCTFGTIHVGNNKHIVEMSEQTSTPITFVPLVILYVDGWPYMMYKDEYALEPLQQFIIGAARTLRKPSHPPSQSSALAGIGQHHDTAPTAPTQPPPPPPPKPAEEPPSVDRKSVV